MSNPFAEGGDGDRTVIRPQPARPQPAANPFEGDSDGDRTVIRPTPSGVRAARPAVRPAAPAPPAPPVSQPPAAPPQARPAPPRPAPPRAAPPRATATGAPPAAPPAVPLPQAARAASDGSDTRIRRTTAPTLLSKAAEPELAELTPGPDLSALASAHADPLLAAAAPLLLLLGRLRAAEPPDPGDVRARTLREVRAFERQARSAGVPMEQVRPVHLALCASLDDAALNTPWGRASGWEAASLTRTLHQEDRGGQAFLDQIEALRRDPAANPVGVEVAYLCLALGFLGPLRDAPGGQQRAEALRHELHTLVRARQPKEDELAPHVAGVAAPYRPQRTRFPVWVAGSAALALAAGTFAWILVGLNGRSDEVGSRMLAAPPAAMPVLVRSPLVQPPPPPPPAPEPTLAERLRDALRADLEAGRLLVRETSSGAIVQVGSRGLFAPGGATLLPAATPLLEHVALAVKDAGRDRDAPAQPAPQPAVRVVGYTDNQPTRTVRFPSNFQLSAAQATAVRGVLAKTLGDPSRIPSEGRADADPVAPNATPEGREQNRRIEVVVQRPADR